MPKNGIVIEEEFEQDQLVLYQGIQKECVPDRHKIPVVLCYVKTVEKGRKMYLYPFLHAKDDAQGTIYTPELEGPYNKIKIIRLLREYYSKTLWLDGLIIHKYPSMILAIVNISGPLLGPIIAPSGQSVRWITDVTDLTLEPTPARALVRYSGALSTSLRLIRGDVCYVEGESQ